VSFAGFVLSTKGTNGTKGVFFARKGSGVYSLGLLSGCQILEKTLLKKENFVLFVSFVDFVLSTKGTDGTKGVFARKGSGVYSLGLLSGCQILEKTLFQKENFVLFVSFVDFVLSTKSTDGTKGVFARKGSAVYSLGLLSGCQILEKTLFQKENFVLFVSFVDFVLSTKSTDGTKGVFFAQKGSGVYSLGLLSGCQILEKTLFQKRKFRAFRVFRGLYFVHERHGWHERCFRTKGLWGLFAWLAFRLSNS